MARLDKVIALKNTSPTMKRIWDPSTGDQLSLAPFEVRELPAHYADMFLQMCAPHVIPYELYSGVPAPTSEQDSVWLANMRGTPFCKKKIAKKRVVRGQVEEFVIDNPMLIPQNFVTQMDIGQKNDYDGDGNEIQINLPKIGVDIPSYARVVTSKECAKFIIGRCGMQDEELRDWVKVSRAPTAFEPNVTWSVSDILLYIHMTCDDLLDKEIGEVKTGLTAGEELNEVNRLLRLAHFVIADPAYMLPARPDFESRKKSMALKEEARLKAGKAKERAEVGAGA